LKNESYIQKQNCFEFPTSFGDGFYVHTFWDPIEHIQHLAFVKGKITAQEPILVRMHAECMTGDIFSDSLTCSSHYLKKSFEKIQKNGQGIFVYIRVPNEPDRSLKWISQKTKNPPMDTKNYGTGAQILKALGVEKLTLLTNSPTKRVGIRGYGLKIVNTIPLDSSQTEQKIHGK